jgi:hypothetical protein
MSDFSLLSANPIVVIYLVEVNSDSSLPILAEIYFELAPNFVPEEKMRHTVVRNLLVVLDRHFVELRSRILLSIVVMSDLHEIFWRSSPDGWMQASPQSEFWKIILEA